MIKDPPALTIRRAFPRPTPAEVAAFAGVPTGYVVDALGGRGALDYRIKPLLPVRSVMVGVAVTCHCGPADNLAAFGALEAAKAGDVVVAATDCFSATALVGDLYMGMARNRGLVGLVTDGLARDLPGIQAVALPIYCAGVTPNSPARVGPGTVGLPVVVGGSVVESGDIVIGDVDGVVVVRRAEAAAVIAKLADIRAAEAALEAKVKGGLEVPEFFKAVLTSGRVVEVE
jgi:4-hydroxy-4-methyl-2-oxoglutarate aldolase